MAGSDLFALKENIVPLNSSPEIGSTDPSVSVSAVSPYAASEERKDDFMPPTANQTKGIAETVTSQELYDARRFPVFNREKTEEDFAYGQSAWDKAKFGIGKFAGITAQTIANDTAGLIYGIGAAIGNQKFSSLYDNEWSKMMDAASERMETYMPNYYTEAEKRDPLALSSIFTGNFFWDKIIKNLGFSAGTAVSVLATGGVLEALNLSKGLVMGGRALQALEATEAGIVEGKGIASMINSLKNVSVSGASKFGSVLEGLGTVSTGAKYSKANLGISSFLSSTGESSIESYQNKKEFEAKGIEEFERTNGRPPEGAELEEIRAAADHVGNFTFGLNMALLTVSNYIQMPKIFGSTYSGEKRAINDAIFRDGLWKSALPTSPFGKALYGTYKGASLLFNTAEAFEEGAQYAVQTGTNNFFSKKNNKDNSFLENLGGVLMPGGEGVLGHGVTEALTSDQGLESILIGGLSGALMTSGIVGINKGRPAIGKTGKIGERGVFGYGGEQGELREKTISTLNKTSFMGKLRDFTDSINIAQTVQAQREQAIKSGDILESKDLETDYMMSYLLPRVKYAGVDAITQEVNDARQRAITDFTQLQADGYADKNDTKENFLARLDNVENMAKLVEANYGKFSTLYSSITATDKNGQVILDEEGNPIRKYSDEIINKLVYAQSKIADYNKRIGQIEPKLLKVGASLGDIIDGINENASPEEITKLIDIQADKIINNKELNDTDKGIELGNLQDAVEIQMRKKQYIKEQNEMISTPEAYTTPEEQPEGAPKETINVKNKDGQDTGVELGTEYYVGRALKNKKGKVYNEFTNFTVVGENEDGTIKLNTDKGIFDVTKEQMQSMLPSMAKTSDLEKNKKLKFWKDHANTIFEFNFGKERGGKVKGRLRLSPKEGILLFEYKDKNDKVKSIEVTGDQFVAKKGFKNALITAVGELSPVQRESMDTYTAEVDPRTAKKLANRAAMVEELYMDANEKLEESKKLAENKKAELAKLEEEIKKLTEKVEGQDSITNKTKRFKATTHKAIQSIAKLNKLRDQLTQELSDLEAEQEQLQINLEYINDLYDNLDQYDEDTKAFYFQLKAERDAVEDAVLETGKQINIISKLLKNVEDALSTAVKFAKDLISKFESKYPNLPLGQADLRDFLNSNIEETEAAKAVTPTSEGQKMLPYTAVSANLLADLATFDRELSEIDELDVIPNERTLEELGAEMKALQDQLSDYEKQLIAKNEVLFKFKVIYDQYQKQKREEAKLVRNQALIGAVIGTLDVNGENAEFDGKYEADGKKDASTVGSATKAPSVKFNDGEPLRDHHVRANKFGNNVDKFENRDQLRAVVVTSANEAELGLGGLMEHLAGTSGVDPTDTVAVVMVQIGEDGQLQPVDVDGKVLDVVSVDNAIYQVMPKKLSWGTDGKKSMFRAGTDQGVIDAVTEEYEAWRKETLANPVLEPLQFSASFGNPEYVTYTKEDGTQGRDYTASTPLEDTGLVSQEDFTNEQLLTVPTTDTPLEAGSTRFENPLGRVFLMLKNAFVPLKNRQLTKREAETIYSAIYRLSVNLTEKGTLKGNDEAERLFNWLRTIINWGTPNNKAGYSSVWFEAIPIEGSVLKTMRLFISGKGESFDFTPSNLEARKEDIIFLLNQLYNNVNARRVNDNRLWSQPYEEITSISKDGVVEAKDWNNYQEYLLSSEGRNENEIPLTSNMRPLENKDDVNREGVYFTLNDRKEEFTTLTPKQRAKASKLTPGKLSLTPEAPVATEEETTEEATPKAPVAEAPVTKTPITTATPFEMDGETANEIELNNTVTGEVLSMFFTIDAEGNIEFLSTGPYGAQNKVTVRKFKEQGVTEEQIYGSAEVKISNLLQATTSLSQEEVEEVLPQEIVDEAEEVTDTEITDDSKDRIAKKLKAIEDSGVDDRALREVIQNQVDRFEGENWTDVEAFLKSKFPNVPVYRVKNVIKATNGRQAWGMFQDGAIYLYENAEVGTVYHEVFHAVWRMFTDKAERAAITNEFRSRKGSFVERTTGKEIKHSEATEDQIEEALAEELRDYFQSGKVPTKPSTGRPFIVKFFADLLQMIKEFFTGNKAQTNTEALFAKVGSGYYAQYAPYTRGLAFAKQGIMDITDAEVSQDALFRGAFTSFEANDIVQHMLYRTITDIVDAGDSLFKATADTKRAELYERLRDDIETRILLGAATANKLVKEGKITKVKAEATIAKYVAMADAVMTSEKDWNEIVDKYEEKLKAYGIEFDENDHAQLTSDERSGKETWADANKIDSFKKANPTIKLLLSSVPYINADGKIKYSTINGARLMPTSEVYMAIMNKVHASRNIDDMVENLRQLALSDSRYAPIYTRLTKNPSVKEKGLSNIKTMADVMLVSAFWKSFKKQNPDVKNVFILDNGDVVVGDSNFTSAARELRNDYIGAIKSTVRSANQFFEYKEEDKAYYGKKDSIAEGKLSTLDSKIEFLKALGINFDKKTLTKLFNRSNGDQMKFATAVENIRKSINDANKIMSFSGKTLDIDGRLLELAEVQAKIDNPEFSSTFFNVNGERTQTFIGTSAISDLYDVLSQIDSLNELEGTQYQYILTDSFAQNSIIISDMFDLKSPEKKRKKTEALFKPGYVDGVVDSQTGRKSQSSRLKYAQRLTQEINMNLKGFFLNLVPGDASMEHMVYLGTHVSEQELLSGYKKVQSIFKGYFIDEFNLSKEDRRIVEIKGKDRKATDLRFFKDILGPKLHAEIVAAPVEDGTSAYDTFEKQITAAVEAYLLSETEKAKNLLTEYGIIATEINENEEDPSLTEHTMVGVDGKTELSDSQLKRTLEALTANYMIANIELHKLMYSDPYQYKDELKRIKNFNSPRQALLYGSSVMNSTLNTVWNEGYKKGDIGRTDFTQGFFKTATLDDVVSLYDMPGFEEEEYEEGDGGGIITFKAHRNFRIRAGEWNDLEEKQYRYDVAWEKMDKGLFDQMSDAEQALLDGGNPEVKSAYTPVKPIVSGNKLNGKTYNDVMLDKFALYPISYRIASQINPESNLVKFYNKMQDEKIDYAVFQSARKVGAEETHNLYTDNGDFNTTPIKGIVNVPFEIMSVQSEVPSKDSNLVTRGSQVTKLITMDMMQAGVPVDFMPTEKNFAKRYAAWNSPKTNKEAASPLYKEIKTNQNLLQEITENGYRELLDLLGITKTNEGYKITNPAKVAATLREELTKREINDNITAALEGFISGEVILEATPAYQQIRNILYSIADSNVISPKINGGMKVQIPVTLMESSKIKKENGKFVSDTLKFYVDKDGQRVCEIMIGRWFDTKMTDEQLLEYLNTTDEGKQILEGLGFRIPTQKQNSIDAFRVAKFLPKEFGDSVVIPSKLVKKVGSDFDIDKLSLYLKSVFTNREGKPEMFKIIKDSEQATKDYYAGVFDELIQSKEQTVLNQLFRISNSEFVDIDTENNLNNKLARIGEKRANKESFVRNAYKAALQNAYIQSSQNLVSSKENFGQLVKPNSAEQLKTLAKEINKLRGITEVDYTATGNMLDRGFMTKLRHDFVTGKYAIGIAAVNQTNHANNQRDNIFVDTRKIKGVSLDDAMWLADGLIKFKNVNMIEVDGQMMVSLSGIRSSDPNKEGDYISDILGQFIDGYVDISKGPWIMDLGATPDVAGTYMFLAKAGVPIDTVAYFMNQPIIRQYLKSLDVQGKSWLFNKGAVKGIIGDYGGQMADIKEIPSNASLKESIEKGGPTGNIQEDAMQVGLLREFLKYAKMANQLYVVTQGTNFDTASFNDPYLIFKKQMQLQQARQSIISSADKLLQSSFVGSIQSNLNKVRDAIAEILVSDQKQVRAVIEQVLTPYVNLNDRDFVKVAQKAVNDLFDWAVQVTDKQWTDQLYRVLVDNNKNVAKHVAKFKDEVKKDKDHPLYNNQILNLMSFTDSSGDHLAVKNIKIKNKENKTYDQNQMIYAFQELKDYLYGQPKIAGISGKNFYKQIVGLSFLQSGLSTSNISFTNILPYEDFKDIYADVLGKINNMDNLQSFHDLGVFYRNNWSDDTFTPYTKASWIKAKATGKSYYNLSMAFGGDLKGIQEATNNGQIPQMLNLSVSAPGTHQDMMVYSWETTLDKNYKKDRALKKAMRARGDYSYIKKGLFQKMYMNGEPIIYNNYKENWSYLYKAVNAWGYGRNANEFYDTAQVSKLDNGFVKVDEGDSLLVNKFGTKKIKTSPERSDTDILDKLLPIIGEKLLPSMGQIGPEALMSDEAPMDDVLESTNVTPATSPQQTENWQEEDNTCTNPIG
jgi:hypothetical protein